MKLAFMLLLFFPVSVYAHHWIGFISCGFRDLASDRGDVLSTYSTAIAPNFGRVFVKIKNIAFIRGYKEQKHFTGPTCSTVAVVSGDKLHVIGSIDNILMRLEKAHIKQDEGDK